jgi:hypothetical protein
VSVASIFALKPFSCQKGTRALESGQGTGEGQIDVARDVNKDLSIQELNLEERKKRAGPRFPGDTLELMEYVIKTYERGTYLVDCDRTFSYNVPQSAVIYDRAGGGMYIYAILAQSKPDGRLVQQRDVPYAGGDDERLIEQKNVIGFNSSYIDFDSTELGTAFFYLTLFHYSDGSFSKIWDFPVPVHGGFNRMTMEKWAPKGIPYIRVNFHDSPYSGHQDFNYFLVNGKLNPPHLLMTYDGINMKRTIADVNKDSIPDYCEYAFVETMDVVKCLDSVYFVWKDSLYYNTRNPKQTQRF